MRTSDLCVFVGSMWKYFHFSSLLRRNSKWDFEGWLFKTVRSTSHLGPELLFPSLESLRPSHVEIIGWKLSSAFLLSWHLVHPGGFTDNGDIGTQFKVWELVQRAIVKLVESRTNIMLNCRLRGYLPSWWDFHLLLWVTFGFNVCRCSGVAMRVSKLIQLIFV